MTLKALTPATDNVAMNVRICGRDIFIFDSSVAGVEVASEEEWRPDRSPWSVEALGHGRQGTADLQNYAWGPSSALT
jgi:hypothetical protein